MVHFKNMVSTDYKHKNFQNLIFLILWVFIFTIPVLLSLKDDDPDETRTIHEMVRIFPFFLLFLINNIFTYKFVEKKKYIHYAIITIATIIGISFLASNKNLLFDIMDIPLPPEGGIIVEQQGPPPPDQFKGELRRPPPPDQFKGELRRPPPPPPGQFNPELRGSQPENSGNPHLFIDFFYNFIFSFLVLGLNNSIKMTFSWMEDKKEYEELQKENLKTELAYLQHQINPHFFMNTLNNIHALIDFDSEIAKSSVMKLSKLMRVLLYDSERTDYTLKKEIDFLNDYIELMRIRLNEDTEIKFNYPETITDVKLHPLLFVNFIENAFKHGIKAVGKSFIHINIEIRDKNLFFEVSNSKTNKTKTDPRRMIGLENSRKRLELLYKNDHQFEVIDKEESFTVKIKIPAVV